jgi:hypothetical protein
MAKFHVECLKVEDVKVFFFFWWHIINDFKLLGTGG